MAGEEEKVCGKGRRINDFESIFSPPSTYRDHTQKACRFSCHCLYLRFKEETEKVQARVNSFPSQSHTPELCKKYTEIPKKP